MMRSCPLVVALGLCAAVAESGQFAFDPPIVTTLPEGHGPTTVRLADLDGDGLLDAVVPGRNYTGDPKVPGRVAVLKGLGDGTFAAWPEIVIGETQSEDVAIADFDGDGKLDLAITLSTRLGRVLLLHGNGDGTFGRAVEVLLERQPRGLVAADLDGDGDIDLAAVNYLSGSVTVLANEGGTFAPAATRRLHAYIGGIPYPVQIQAPDATGDGRPDLITTAIGGGRVGVLAAGEGVVPARTVDWRPLPIGGESPAVIGASIADFDGDGAPDIALPVLLVTQSQKVVLLRNDGSAGFAERSVFDSASFFLAWCSAPIDIDGDGRIDLAIGTALSGSVVFMRNTTPSPGAAPILVAEPLFVPYGIFVRDLVAADIDNDGDQDVVGVEIAGSTLFVLRNRTGEGGVAAATEKPKQSDRPHRAAADRNDDGAIDGLDLAIELEAFRPRLSKEATR